MDVGYAIVAGIIGSLLILLYGLFVETTSWLGRQVKSHPWLFLSGIVGFYFLLWVIRG